MWIFTKYGFFSAVCARQDDATYGHPVDPDRIMVRARRRNHLERLLNRFTDLTADTPIHQSTESDYRYRVFLPKPVWANLVQQLAIETDYDNFKSKAADEFADEDIAHEYGDALHDVWNVMYGFQCSES